MKTFVILAVSIASVNILFCPLAMAAPPMPSDVQMVQPDPSLPKEIAGFWGKWEGRDQLMELFIIVEKIDEEKASVYIWSSAFVTINEGWKRCEGKIIKENGKYKLHFPYFGDPVYLALKGEYLDVTTPGGEGQFSRVP
jgi:hypothetical protein